MVRLSKEQIKNLPEWIPVIGFEGLYEVNCREGFVRNAKTLRVLKPKYYNGYPQVWLSKDGRKCAKKVHRIIAVTVFHHYGISTDGLCVCHLDEERNVPRVANLALGSRKENSNFPKAKQRYSEAKSKRVGAYKNGELVMIFQSTQEAGRNGFDSGNVSACCTGRRRVCKGYEWRFL